MWIHPNDYRRRRCASAIVFTIVIALFQYVFFDGLSIHFNTFSGDAVFLIVLFLIRSCNPVTKIDITKQITCMNKLAQISKWVVSKSFHSRFFIITISRFGLHTLNWSKYIIIKYFDTFIPSLHRFIHLKLLPLPCGCRDRDRDNIKTWYQKRC